MKHKAKRLTIQQPVLPQCSVVNGSNAYNAAYLKRRAERLVERGYDPTRCSAQGSVEIDGRPYCKRHAGIVALNILLDGEIR